MQPAQRLPCKEFIVLQKNPAVFSKHPAHPLKPTKNPDQTPRVTTAPALQLPPLNYDSQKYQKWLDTVQRDGLRLSGRQVTILLDLFGVVEDVVSRASNILEKSELIPSAKE